MFGPVQNPHRVAWAGNGPMERPADTIYVGPPSRWSPPWAKDAYAPEEMVQRYETYLENNLATGSLDLSELTGYHLACRCPLNRPCHADVLLRLANRHRTELEAVRRNFVASVDELLTGAGPLDKLAQKAVLGKSVIEATRQGRKVDLSSLVRLASALDAEVVLRRPPPKKKGPLTGARLRRELEEAGVIFDDRRGRAVQTAGPVPLETLVAVISRLVDPEAQ